MFEPAKEVQKIISQATEEQIIDFYQDAEAEGDVVWYVENRRTVFVGNENYDKALEQPFAKALEFLRLLYEECENFTFKQYKK